MSKASSRKQFEGRWRITDSSNWSPEDLDLVGAAQILFKRDGAGELQMVAIEGTLDYRISHRDGESVLEFSWAGFDQGDEVGGRGTARIERGILKGELFVHQGDNATFAARRED